MAPTRRAALLSALAGSVAALPLAAAAPPLPDAELVELCAQWHVLTDRIEAASDDDEADALHDDGSAIFDRIEALAPVSKAGLRAKARLAVRNDAEGGDGRMAHAVCRDLIADERNFLAQLEADAAERNRRSVKNLQRADECRAAAAVAEEARKAVEAARPRTPAELRAAVEQAVRHAQGARGYLAHCERLLDAARTTAGLAA